MSELAELFSRDPYSLSNSDITKIVHVFRERRQQYKLGVITTKASTKKSSPAKATPTDGVEF